MKNLFYLFVLILGQQILAQDIVIAPKDTVRSIGDTIVLQCPSGKICEYYWAYKSSVVFTDTLTVVVPDPGTVPGPAHISTTADEFTDISNWMDSSIVIPPAQYLNLDSVPKENVLYTRVWGGDSLGINIYPTEVPIGLQGSVAGDHEEYYSDSSGIFVKGNRELMNYTEALITLAPDSSSIIFSDSIVLAESFSIEFEIDTALALEMSDSQIIFQGPITICPTLVGCAEVDSMYFDLISNSFTVWPGGAPETFSIGDLVFMGDSLYVSLPLASAQGQPNFAILQYFNWLDLYSDQLDKEIAWKRSKWLLMDGPEVVFSGYVTLRQSGQYSCWFIQPTVTIDLGTQDLEYNDWSGSKHKYKMRMMGQNWNPSGDMFGRAVMSKLDLTPEAGYTIPFFMNGDYNGMRNMFQHMNARWVAEKFDMKKKDVELYIWNDWFKVMPVDVHRDSVSTRQLRFGVVYDYLIALDPQSPTFLRDFQQRIHIRSWIQVMFISPFLNRSDYGGHNSRFFLNKYGQYQFLGKDFDGLLTECWGVYHNLFFEQMYDTTSLAGNQLLTQKILFLHAMQNEEFRSQAMIIIAEMLNTVLSPAQLSMIWESVAEEIDPHVQSNYERLAPISEPLAGQTYAEFQNQKISTQCFCDGRAQAAFDTLAAIEGVSSTQISFSVIGAEHGQVAGIDNTVMYAQDSIGREFTLFTDIKHSIHADTLGFVAWVINGDTISNSSFSKVFSEDTVYNLTAYYDFQVDSLVYTGLRLNELVSKNQSVIADESGKFPDYIEIINTLDTVIRVDGFYLTDDPSEPRKAMLTGVLGAGEKKIFFADNDEEDGSNHLSFRVKSGGEPVLLTDGTDVLDSIPEVELWVDQASGICAEQQWLVQIPTPLMVNDCGGVLLPINLSSFDAYSPDDSCVQVIWQTGIDQEVTLLRSVDGISSDSIYVGTGEAFLDCNVEKGMTYHYRLMMANGLLSPIRTVTIDNQVTGLDMYPVPATDFLFVDKPGMVSIYNTLGQQVLYIEHQGGRVNITSLETGHFYLLHHSSKGENLIGKFSVIK